MSIISPRAESAPSAPPLAEIVETLREVRDGVGCQPGYINSLGLRKIDALLAKLEPVPVKVDALPCPFCGGKARLHERYKGLWIVGCDACDVWLDPDQRSQEACHEAWNRRAEIEAERAVVVPENVAAWVKDRRGKFNEGGWLSNAERDTCDFILSLIDGATVRAPFSEEVIAAAKMFADMDYSDMSEGSTLWYARICARAILGEK